MNQSVKGIQFPRGKRLKFFHVKGVKRDLLDECLSLRFGDVESGH